MNKTITREQFVSAFDKVFGDNDEIFDKILDGFITTHYMCFYREETVYIVDLHNEELITWYKLIEFITRPFDTLIIKSEEFLPKIKELGIKITNYERI